MVLSIGRTVLSLDIKTGIMGSRIISTEGNTAWRSMSIMESGTISLVSLKDRSYAKEVCTF